jgi:serine/threonine-protein kinase
MSTDRNLLFGILALQMDLVSRDALIQAMNAWVLEKSKPLGQILQEQGALSEADSALLEPLVERHLQLHGGDAERSLAAVSVSRSIQQALRSIPDEDIQASVAAFTTQLYTDPNATAPEASHGPDGSRYRILRPHAKGGLGEVFVAEDTELHREVALKQIQEQFADDPHSRMRFLLEAEVNGRLEHPAIVPVYGLGQDAEGRPYYAMRFIEGDILRETIRRFHEAGEAGQDTGERGLALRHLLGQFVAMCNAVGYAHNRGVIHRDLKPSNVMLGKFGETLLVDWGLAKVVGRTDAEQGNGEGTLQPVSSGELGTVAGSVMGTPTFMSPEQAEGRLDAVGPASDIYGLGATLYFLLTGRAPVEGKDTGQVLRKAARGEWLPPSQVKKYVPKALDAVCCKAMALKPENRYASAGELARDVERWLADEPVCAYPEPLAVRSRRWLGRHRTLVTAVTACAILRACQEIAFTLDSPAA